MVFSSQKMSPYRLYLYASTPGSMPVSDSSQAMVPIKLNLLGHSPDI